MQATLHQQITVTALDDGGDELARVSVSPAFKLTRASATAWVEGGYPPVSESRPRP